MYSQLTNVGKLINLRMTETTTGHWSGWNGIARQANQCGHVGPQVRHERAGRRLVTGLHCCRDYSTHGTVSTGGRYASNLTFTRVTKFTHPRGADAVVDDCRTHRKAKHTQRFCPTVTCISGRSVPRKWSRNRHLLHSDCFGWPCIGCAEPLKLCAGC
jgi:hypothetical protein